MVHSQSSKQAPHDGQPSWTLEDSWHCIQTLVPREQKMTLSSAINVIKIIGQLRDFSNV